MEDVSPDKSELKERLFESDQWEVVSQYPSGQEEPGKETVPVKEMEEAVEKETPFKEEATEEVLTEVPAVEEKLEAEEEACTQAVTYGSRQNPRGVGAQAFSNWFGLVHYDDIDAFEAEVDPEPEALLSG